VGFVAVAVFGAGLVHVATLGIDERNDTIRGDAAHDAPVIVVELDVLARDQGQEPERRAVIGVASLARVEQRQRVTNETIY
jgi:hypothetical protein